MPEGCGKADLDRIVPDRPVWLISQDGHSGWANSAALKQAGITSTAWTKRCKGQPEKLCPT